MADIDPSSLPGGLATVLDWAAELHGDEPGWHLWAVLDGPLRLALAQAWVLNTAGRVDDRRAATLAEANPDSSDAESMLDWYIAHWRRVYDMLAGDFGVFGAPTLVGVDMELVVLVESQHVGYVEAGGPPMAGHSFIVKLRDNDWVIAALSRRLPVPGWPPTEEEIPGLGLDG
ncbi:hypothetical protein [Saccharothrix syringae]|uniref:Uncharacterized protein n=1 Tax=Saccharothrix syringae TaxID=103733 RepID=A0A5Q0H941_SACSY|nr:hypothetical protein [Saccharothrix syringae]QFZ22736.1 hypothetical protein EKG83_39680 [Saccharothrix syringae]